MLAAANASCSVLVRLGLLMAPPGSRSCGSLPCMGGTKNASEGKANKAARVSKYCSTMKHNNMS
jgi:hypothetical protein